MLRVMQINQGEKFGGVSSMIYNLYQHINHDKVQFDFVAPNKSSYEIYRDDIEKMGGRIFELRAKSRFKLAGKLKFWKKLYHLIRTQKYEVVHCNSGSVLFNIQVAWIAKKCKVRKIIIHSHNAGNDGKIKAIMMNACKGLLEFGPTHYFTCSTEAAEHMFSKKRCKKKDYVYIKNGVDISRFVFNEGERHKYREELGISDKKVVMHVGRFCNQKNHSRLIDIFNDLHKRESNTVLVLVGDGEKKKTIEEKVRLLGLSESVIFLGLRKDIPQIMFASDLFLLPSLYEGLPVVGVEAQASGLPCVIADSITKEVDFSGNNHYVSLNDNDSVWSEKILDLLTKDIDRIEGSDIVRKAGFSLQDVAKKLEEIYCAE